MIDTARLDAPFPWYGGKSRVAPLVWRRFGSIGNYVEPFFGSGAVLLGRPYPFAGDETVNDRDGLLTNFWRAVQHDPEQVACYADGPIHECDLHARHAWLVERRDDLTRRLEGDPAYHDAQVAGWWVWGICCWIGGGWCSGEGPWRRVDGRLVKGTAGAGVERTRPSLGNSQMGVQQQLPDLFSARGVKRERPRGGNGVGVHRAAEDLTDWMGRLSARLRRVRVCCGDWTRVLGPSVTTLQGVTGVFLDPPYGHAERDSGIYAVDQDVALAVHAWALAHGDDPLMRIALCGYAGEHAMPDTWTEVAWKSGGGYANLGSGPGRRNLGRERIWFSPHCRPGDLFEYHRQSTSKGESA